ncbi:PREDICTED: uncharacterized protein LOC106812875 [Priapulus caudatus]|uniref:Uncharacterized protein LOC106812875 n=1 Tax=Priapulus caudatus TaxID=37621 RepID=A0ABM1EJI7_PRICU|nr:PREDICTED: uncharacterized protein LOC106812875 [Priapulus caudatus]
MTRDRVVLGIRENETREDLLKIRKLDLDRCIDVCRAAQSVSLCDRGLKPVMPDTVHKIRARFPEVKDKQYVTLQKEQCRFCNFSHVMKKEKCPAFSKTCHICGEKNHFKSKFPDNMRRRQQKQRVSAPFRTGRGRVNQLKEEYYDDVSASNSDYEWCNTVTAQEKRLSVQAVTCVSPTSRMTKCRMMVGGSEVDFQVDTGASVNMLPSRFADKIERYRGVLNMWNKAVHKPAGTCRMKVTNPRNNRRYSVPFVVFEDERQPILGYQTSVQMNLIQVQHGNFDVVAAMSTKDAFAEVYDKKLGELPSTQHLNVRAGAIPVANRRVPIAVRPKLKMELERLKELNVISPVEEPTPWVSQMVVAHKKSGALRICINPHELNKALLREHYTLPVLDDALHELSDSRVFSKTDLASGYWHVKLDRESSLLTTFQTCFGRFRWLRLPFGLCVSSEIFQRKLLEALSDLPGVLCIADNVVVHARTMPEHDERLGNF